MSLTNLPHRFSFDLVMFYRLVETLRSRVLICLLVVLLILLCCLARLWWGRDLWKMYVSAMRGWVWDRSSLSSLSSLNFTTRSSLGTGISFWDASYYILHSIIVSWIFASSAPNQNWNFLLEKLHFFLK